jgi:hypothetical protein
MNPGVLRQTARQQLGAYQHAGPPCRDGSRTCTPGLIRQVRADQRRTEGQPQLARCCCTCPTRLPDRRPSGSADPPGFRGSGCPSSIRPLRRLTARSLSFTGEHDASWRTAPSVTPRTCDASSARRPAKRPRVWQVDCDTFGCCRRRSSARRMVGEWANACQRSCWAAATRAGSNPMPSITVRRCAR